jgi:hypothetical protein
VLRAGLHSRACHSRQIFEDCLGSLGKKRDRPGPDIGAEPLRGPSIQEVLVSLMVAKRKTKKSQVAVVAAAAVVSVATRRRGSQTNTPAPVQTILSRPTKRQKSSHVIPVARRTCSGDRSGRSSTSVRPFESSSSESSFKRPRSRSRKRFVGLKKAVVQVVTIADAAAMVVGDGDAAFVAENRLAVNRILLSI